MNVFIQAANDKDSLVSEDGTKMYTNIRQLDLTTENLIHFHLVELHDTL